MIGIHSTAGFMSQTVDGCYLAMKTIFSDVSFLSKADPTIVPLPWREEMFLRKRKLRVGWYVIICLPHIFSHLLCVGFSPNLWLPNLSGLIGLALTSLQPAAGQCMMLSSFWQMLDTTQSISCLMISGKSMISFST